MAIIEKDYAYVANDGTVHLVDVESTAKGASRDGNVVEIERGFISPSGGVPRIEGRDVFADVDLKTIHIGGTASEGNGQLVALAELPPVLQELLAKLGYKEKE